MMKSFLSKGAHGGGYLPKTSWKQTTLRKNEGGLKIKDLYRWNLACMPKHIWNVCCGKESLWVKWIHTYRKRGQSIWDITMRSIDS
ncbi:hypothetical protein LIER_40012 [Lithospermum erythrorhizon]|uniref:Uncharacterized protein n=1 Tax=Lithospermum erythrorhizon TaxID=34254 RepID=A0AAV3QPC3_LITER